MTSREFILAIDQGTTNTKALLLSRSGDPVFRAARPVALLQPQPGFVEQDPAAIWGSVVEVLRDCCAFASSTDAEIVGIAISNQRETALAWHADPVPREPGVFARAAATAVSWQCRRSSEICNRLSSHGDRIRRSTGLTLDPVVTAGKWAWLLEHHPGLEQLAIEGRLRLGTMDSWLLDNLTGGAVHATDHSNASRTALLSLDHLAWDPDLVALFGLPPAALPHIHSTVGTIGVCTSVPELSGVPLVTVIGDSHGALAGHGRYHPGVVKATYGTGSSLMMLTSALVESSQALARTVAWSTPDHVQFATEGNITMTGSAVQWVGEFLGFASPTSDAVALAATVPDAAGLLFVPAMVGLGAPYWDAFARGSITSLGRFHTAAHLARASVDAIAYQVAEVFFSMEVASDIHPPALLADGGATRNASLMQFQADLLGRSVHRSLHEELSALGAARLGGLALGWWHSLEDLAALPSSVETFEPRMSAAERDRLRDAWKLAIDRTRLHRNEAAA